MHKVKLEDDIVRIAVQRRGRLRLFEDIAPKRTAHLVIDMQTGFMTLEHQQRSRRPRRLSPT